jgi:hypothetical protein
MKPTTVCDLTIVSVASATIWLVAVAVLLDGFWSGVGPGIT